MKIIYEYVHVEAIADLNEVTCVINEHIWELVSSTVSNEFHSDPPPAHVLSLLHCVCVCAPEVQREAEGDRGHERVPRAIWEAVPTGHQAAHVRPGAQNCFSRHEDQSSIPLPGTHADF